jgi:ABC-type antimicrobial peptide transport system permease subunit
VLPQREIRYYFSILKLMLLLLASLAFVAIGWPMIHAGAHPSLPGSASASLALARS